MAKRGQLTKLVKMAYSYQSGGFELSQTELRLMPYVQNCLMNGKNIDLKRVNIEERVILGWWRERGWIQGGAANLSASYEFWNLLSEILWLAYVDHENQSDN